MDGESSGAIIVDLGVRDLSWAPFCFLYNYIDNIVNTSLSWPGSKVSLYADDMCTMLFKSSIQMLTTCADVQNDGLKYWVTANHLTFSSSNVNI